MKKVLVLTCVLCLAASLTQASILQCWVTSVAPVTTSTVNYDLQIWLQVVPDPALTQQLGHVEDITDGGINSVTMSIWTSDSTLVTEPLPPNPNNLTLVKTTFNYDAFDDFTHAAQRSDASWDGDLDAVGAVGATSGYDHNIGVGQPVLLATESWTMDQWAHADLHIEIHPDSSHWDLSDPLGDGSNANYFGGFQIGVDHDGTDLFVGPDTYSPEPATLALLGFGAMATLLRRGNKK